MADYDYELIVIGGGPAGEKGAAQAAYFDHKTCLVEAYRELGGACINWGTLASKTLRESALFLSGFRTRQLGEGMEVEFKANIKLNVHAPQKPRPAARTGAGRQQHRRFWHNIERIRRRESWMPTRSTSRVTMAREKAPRQVHPDRHRLGAGAAQEDPVQRRQHLRIDHRAAT